MKVLIVAAILSLSSFAHAGQVVCETTAYSTDLNEKLSTLTISLAQNDMRQVAAEDGQGVVRLSPTESIQIKATHGFAQGAAMPETLIISAMHVQSAGTHAVAKGSVTMTAVLDQAKRAQKLEITNTDVATIDINHPELSETTMPDLDKLASLYKQAKIEFLTTEVSCQLK